MNAITGGMPATEPSPPDDDRRQWTGLAVRLREDWLLVPRAEVRELCLLPRLARIPGAQPWLPGVANLRGSLVPVTDLGLFCGLPIAPDPRLQRVLLLNSETIPAGFLVDEVGAHQIFGPEDQRPLGAPEQGPLLPWLVAAFVREGERWPVLSLNRLAHSAAFQRVAA